METKILSHTLSTEKLRQLVESESFSEVFFLDISESSVGADGLIALGQSRYTRKLKTLNASNLNAEDSGLIALAESKTLAPDSLWFRENIFTEKGVTALARSKVLSTVRILTLDFNPVGDSGAKALARSSNVGELRHLDLTSAGLSDSGVAAIMGSGNLPKLDTLWVLMNELTPEAIQPLLIPGSLPALRSLMISSAAVTDADKALLLAARPELRLDLK